MKASRKTCESSEDEAEPELLLKHQQYVQEKEGLKDEKPVALVFHGGSGSSKQEFLDAISYGVVKVNVDTDMQYAYTEGIRDYMVNKKEYLSSQVGNPDGADKPNKKYVPFPQDPKETSLTYFLHQVLRPPCLGP